MLEWGAVRTALAVFAAGWVLVQVASAFSLLLEDQWGPELEPAVAQALKRVRMMASAFGLVYFLTAMAMGFAIPRHSGFKRLGWGIVACLALSAAAWALFIAASFWDQQIVGEIINQRIQKAKAGPPAQQDLERALARWWGPDTRKALLVTFIGALGLSKLMFTGLLWATARHFKEERLVSGLVIYLLGEALAVAVAVGIVYRQPVQLTDNDPFVVFTGNWYSVAATSAFCAWFLVCLFQVRRTLTRAMLGQDRA
jgi:hypothetical protein